jgi:4-amino-4-deoxy-L-arabinose transferase-like glycosyltransferase
VARSVPLVLLAIAAGAFALRIVYALAIAPDLVGLDDDTAFHQTSLEIANGNGYVGTLDAFTSESRTKQPIADHPPLYPLMLAMLGWLGARSVDLQRMLGVCAGTLTVFAVGLIARRVAGYRTEVAGRRAAVAAALLCAVYPSFIAADGALMSETLFGTLVAFSLLQALILLERPSRAGMAVLGLLVGLAALTRSEGLLLVPLLALPIAVSARARRLQLVASMIGVAALTVTPWVARNWDVFGEPVYSTNEGATLAGANCDETYYGNTIGGFDFNCVVAARQPRTDNRAVRSRALRQAAVDYALDHVGRAPLVGVARLARLWGFYEPGDQVIVTGRDEAVQRVGIAAYYAVLLAGVVGIALLVRRRRLFDLSVLLVPVLLASITALSTYGLLRVRHIAEVSLLVLAGIAVAQLTASRGKRHAPE